MVVQHNLTAMNSNRMLGLTTSSQAKSTEKLSSGYKINRAADDAAGLSISEKMRKQIRGLTQASANAQDGISAVQTAEGALAEVQDMLQRMNELAVKAANGTNSESDRSYIQNEIDQLVTEIDRVAETTKFNETYLLKGDSAAPKQYVYAYNTVSASAAKVATVSMGANATPPGGASAAAVINNVMNAVLKAMGSAAGVGGAGAAGGISGGSASAAVAAANQAGVSLVWDNTTGIIVGISFSASAASVDQNAVAKGLVSQGLNVSMYSRWDASQATATSGYTVQLNGSLGDNYSIVQSGSTAGTYEILNTAGQLVATFSISGGTVAAATADIQSNVTRATITAADATAAKKQGEVEAYYDKDGNKISANALSRYFATNSSGSVVARVDAPTVYDALGNVVQLSAPSVTNQKILIGDLKLNLHVGADATSNNQISLNLTAMTAKGLGVNGLRVDGTDDSNARSAIETIAEAIQKISTQRSALGAIQNRLEHTINNLDNVVENTTSAESQIRDTDMATEMVQYSNNNILSQAGQAMLAQANQTNQGVLSLLG